MLNLAEPIDCWLLVRSRPRVGETLTARHQAVARGASLLPEQWRPRPSFVEAAPDFGEALSATVDLGLAPTLRGHVTYVFRSMDYLRDTAEFDDVLSIRSKVSPVLYRECIREALPPWIEAMSAYRAAIVTDADLALDDWDRACARGLETGRSEDGRDSVLRIWPVSFFDRELCRRAWGLSPERIAELLAPLTQETRLIADGVLVIATDRIPTREEVIETDSRLRAALVEQ